MSEFDLIQRYFTRPVSDAVLGVGDDAALLKLAAGDELAVSTDMLVSGTHFFSDADPCMLGHKALAVNLSDMAAMGATPRWATLALSLPAADHAWLEQFSQGFFSLAQQYRVELVGGDTTRGPLNLSITIMGSVPQGMALRRDGAKLGDDIWVSGYPGMAALALAQMQGKIVLPQNIFSAGAQRLHQPQPRVELGLALRGIAHSAIDISDGLLADVGHILERSHVAAEIRFDALALPPAFAQQADFFADVAVRELWQRCVLAGGDDYELCFTAPLAQRGQIEKISATLALPLQRIGQIVAGQGCMIKSADGNMVSFREQGYDHFA